MNADIVGPVVATVTFFGFMAYLVKALVNIRIIKERSKLNEKALDKIGSSKEISEFLKTKQGEEFLMGMSKTTLSSREKLLNSIFWGIVVFFSGIGIYIIKNVVTEDPGAIEAMGIVVIFIGIGMLIASVASLFFAKQWGLLNGDSKSSK